jgi:hypothetical protein
MKRSALVLLCLAFACPAPAPASDPTGAARTAVADVGLQQLFGRPPQEVRQALGHPGEAVCLGANIEVWVYRWGKEKVVITFENGQVTSAAWGVRQTGYREPYLNQ